MKHTLIFEWNGKLVATAQATSAMAYEFACSFFEDQFTGPAFKQWFGTNFSNLLHSLEMDRDRHATHVLDYRDSTGHARLEIRQ